MKRDSEYDKVVVSGLCEDGWLPDDKPRRLVVTDNGSALETPQEHVRFVVADDLPQRSAGVTISADDMDRICSWWALVRRNRM